MNAVADKLDEARALIEKGWCQYEFVGGHHCLREALEADNLDGYCFCAIGALAVVNDWHHESEVSPDGIEYLAEAAGMPGANWTLISDWNDAEGRTQAEVVDAFKRAAELARAEA